MARRSQSAGPEPNPAGDDNADGRHDAHDAHARHADRRADEAARRSARAEFDRLFLTFMIQHHRGAVTMVQELFASRGAAKDETVFKFAADVNVDQTTEINRMLEMLLVAP